MNRTQTAERPILIPTHGHIIYLTSMSSSKIISTTESNENYTNEKGDSEYPSEAHYMEIAGIVPVAFLGLLGNIIALLVWTAKVKYNPTTLLLKHLCVWDSLFLMTYAAMILAYDSMPPKVIDAANFLIPMFLLMSIHVTLGAIVTRLLAVTRPLVVRDLLTKRRVYIVYVGVIVWCLVLASLEIVAVKGEHLDDNKRWNIFVSSQVIGLMLPYLALLMTNLFLFYFLMKHRTISRQSLRRSSSVTNRRTDRRLILTLICLSVCSLFTYPPGSFFKLLRTAELLGLISASSTCDWECSVIVEKVFHLLQVLNSSVNIIFYSAFSTQFRQLFLRRVQQFSGLGRSLFTSSSSSSKREVETADPKASDTM